MSAQSDRFRVLRRLTEIRFEDELRGYSKNQVDRVLETLVPLADDVEQLQAKLAEAEGRVAAAEASLLEQQAAAAHNEAVARQEAASRQDATDKPFVAAIESDGTMDSGSTVEQTPPDDFDETLRNTLMLAQRTADGVVREAKEDADRLLSSARLEADELVTTSKEDAARFLAEGESARSTMVADAEGERNTLMAAARDSANAQITAIESELSLVHDAQREELVQQIGELRRIRDLLADDIDNFEGYLAERRETVRSAMSEINVVLDDPARLRPSIPPMPNDVGELDPAVHEPIKIELVSLAGLNVEEGSAATDALAIGVATDLSIVDADGPAVEADSAEIIVDVLEIEADVPPTPVVANALVGSELDDRAEPASETNNNPEANTDGTESAGAADANLGTDADADADADSALGGAGEDRESLVADVGMATEAVPIVTPGIDLTDTAAPLVSDPWAPGMSDDDEGSEGQLSDSGRPAWADNVPGLEVDEYEATPAPGADPFLEELRKATSDDAAGNEDNEAALSRFLSEDMKEPTRGGWFGRRR